MLENAQLEADFPLIVGLEDTRPIRDGDYRRCLAGSDNPKGNVCCNLQSDRQFKAPSGRCDHLDPELMTQRV